MRDFSKRGASVRRFAMSVGGLLILLVITAGAARAAWGMYGKFADAAESNRAAQIELINLTAQEAQVADSVSSLNSPRGVEAEVRERYGVVKPGEGVIQIVQDAASTSPQVDHGPNPFMRLWDALFGWI